MKANEKFIPYHPPAFGKTEMIARSSEWYAYMNTRRTVREFSSEPVPREAIENAIMTASSAPSGANKQPWTFCVVADPETKKAIRKAAEKEEYENYTHRMTEEWLKDLEPFGTDFHKPFLETAPYLIVVMKHTWEPGPEGKKLKNYYVNESVGIAVGFLLTALHQCGLAALTHTPSPMRFLKEILQRPEHEQPYLLIPVGLPANGVKVPDITRKPKEEVLVWY